MNLPLVELLPTDPFLRFGGEHRIFSPLRISETGLNECQCVPNADGHEKRYILESNRVRCGDHEIPQILHEVDDPCRKVVEVRIRSADQ